MHGRLCWLLWLVLVLSPATSHADIPERPRFRVLGPTDGLPSTPIGPMAQDADGYFWLATRDGLLRYDGVSFLAYHHDANDRSSLPGNAVSALHLDPRGRLWIGLDNGAGVARRDPGKAGFVRFDPERIPAVSNTVWTIRSTPDGSTWFGTFTSGLVRVTADGRWLQYLTGGVEGLPSNEVMALEVDEAGSLWVGTGAGLTRWTGERFAPQDVGDLDEPRIVAMHADSEGLWIGTMQGLRLRRADGSVIAPTWLDQLPHRIVFATLRDARGTRWFATRNGLAAEHDNRVEVVQAGGAHGFGYGPSLFEDREGDIWVAQFGHALLRLPRSSRSFSVFNQGTGNADSDIAWIRGLAPAKEGGAWIVGIGGGVERVDVSSGRVERVVSPDVIGECRGHSLHEAKDAVLWIGCYERLVRYEPRSGKYRDWTTSTPDGVHHGPIEGIVSTADQVWVSMTDAVQVRDPAGHVVTTFRINDGSGLEGNIVIPASIGPDGRVWLSDGGALKRWRSDNKRWEVVPGQGHEATTGFGFHDPRTVWLRQRSGLERYGWNGERLEWQRRVSEANGLPGVNALHLVVDRAGDVWMPTARGLIRYRSRTGSIRTFGIADGLPSQEFDPLPAVISQEGMILASTSAGLVAFDPAEFVESIQAPEVQIDQISLRRGDASITIPSAASRIVLRPEDRDLRITARIASLVDARTRRYRFRLEGYDPKWIEDSEGERVFTRLDHGTYHLAVIAASADGVWSAPKRIEVVVLPAWWQTGWARAAFAIAFLSLVAAMAWAYRVRLRIQHEKRLLHERREAAERASAAKTRFLADFGHEVRTPMTGVLGMAELLQAEVVEPRQRARVEAIQSAGQHLLRLVNDALDIARIEAGRLELQDVVFDLSALVADVETLLRPQAEAKGIGLAISLPVGMSRHLHGDPVRLRQVLLNLGQNALKFTIEGRVNIEAKREDDVLAFVVMDTGCGLTPAQQARLFQRFEQPVDAVDPRQPRGSGLGLAICRELARAMGGDLVVASTAGSGSHFTLTIPLREAAPPDEALPLSCAVRDCGGPAIAILLVEDDAIVADVVHDLLAAQGHEVDRAPHALAALVAVTRRDYDLVLVDLDLPDLDGMSLARLWHAQALKAPLVALTARPDAEAEPAARAAGMVDFVRKPVSGEMLATMVARHARKPTERIPYVLDAHPSPSDATIP